MLVYASVKEIKTESKEYGTSGSYAGEYCAEYDNLTFIASEMPTHTPGDINGDGKFNLKDVTRLKIASVRVEGNNSLKTVIIDMVF